MADEKIRYVLDVDDKGTPKLVKFGQTAATAGDKASKGFGKASKSVGDFGKELPGVSGALGMFAGGPAVAAGAAVGALAAGFGTAITKSIMFADSLNDMSDRLGVSVETLSKLSPVAELGGTSLEALTGVLGKFSAKVAAGDKGIKGLNLSTTDAVGAMVEIADKVKGATSQTEAIAIAQAAYGKQWQELMPILKMGGGAIRSTMDGAATVTQEMAAQSAAVADQLTVIQNRFLGVGLGIAEHVLPFVDQWLSGVSRILDLLGMIPDAQKRANDRAAIIETYGKVQADKRNARTGATVKGSFSIGGKTLQQALAEFDAANPQAAPEPFSPASFGDDGTTKPAKAGPKGTQAGYMDRLGVTYYGAGGRQNSMNQGDAGNFTTAESVDFGGMSGMPPDFYAGLPVTEKAKASLEKKYDDEAEKEDKARQERSQALLESQQAMADKSADILVQSGMAGFQVFDDMFARMAQRNAEMSDSWTKTFQGIGLAFTSMLTKMIEEMAVKAAIFGALSLFSGGTLTPGGGGLMKFLGFASGGMPPVGQPVNVGERRPETFVPRTAGHIQPTAGPGTVINITVSNPAEARSTARQLQREDRTRKKGLR